MIKKRKLSLATTAREMRIPASELKRGERFPQLMLINARHDRGKLVTAEGGAKYAFVNPENRFGVVHFCLVGQDYHAYVGDGLTYANNKSAIRAFTIGKVNKFLPVQTPDGKSYVYALTDDTVYVFEGAEYYPSGLETGAACGAVHSERFFCAKGDRLSYSDVNAVIGMNEESGLGAGHLELTGNNLGHVKEMFSWKDRLYLLHERGISVVRAYNDPTNYKFTILPCFFQDLRENSAALCGEHIYFVADGGLYSFNGGVVRALNEPSFSEVDTTREMRACGYDNKYYARVYRKDGMWCVYCYDPVAATGYFLAEGAHAVYASDRLYFCGGQIFYRVKPRGYFDFSPVSRLNMGSIILSESGRDCFFEGIDVQGNGSFHVIVEADTGVKDTFTCNAGVRAVPSVPLRGKSFTVTFEWTDVNTEIETLTIAYREVVK